MYSQGKEELYTVNFFKDRIGNVLDVGANDGKSLSNSLRLIELGWNGVMVEASPKAFIRLQETHKGRDNVYLFNLALTDHDGECELNESGAVRASKCSRDNVGLVSSLNNKWMKPWGTTHFDKIQIPCRSWKTFLEESPIKKFNFISIDIEGEDAKLLEQINLEEVGCELLCIEYIYPETIIVLTELCKKQGFKVVGRTKCNLLFAKG